MLQRSYPEHQRCSEAHRGLHRPQKATSRLMSELGLPPRHTHTWHLWCLKSEDVISVDTRDLLYCSIKFCLIYNLQQLPCVSLGYLGQVPFGRASTNKFSVINILTVICRGSNSSTTLLEKRYRKTQRPAASVFTVPAGAAAGTQSEQWENWVATELEYISILEMTFLKSAEDDEGSE